jgi:site-specific DNA-methyltransferase (adenine-specific)
VVVWVVADATINGSETGTSFRQALWAMECGFRLHDTMIYHRENLPQNRDRYEQHFEYMFVFGKGAPKTFNAKQEPCKTAGQKQKIVSRHKEEKGARHEKAKGKKWITGEFKTSGNIWKYQVGKGMGDALQHEHPASFPEALANDHIISWSNPGDLVFDCFLGSGTTGKMAIRNGRKFIGCDIEADYVDIARQRIENEETAVLNRAGKFTTTQKEKESGQLAIWDI